ncbi:mycothiol synthase [Nocardioides sp.]|uniref:mycothiol synthase n=1 Tax=Nocardioides sp. TaxID=35761 RepID=UPI002ECFC19D
MDAERVRLIADIAAESEASDGAAPIDEATWLTLRNRADDVESWVTDEGFALVAGGDLSLTVRPAARRKGVGESLLGQALATHTHEGALQAWSHADHPAAARLAARHGFEKVRELWVMRRPAAEPVGEVSVPEGVVIRSYRVGDQSELLRVNAAAFADHPEQGSMSESDLAERMGEPWFDADGLLVAIDDGRMLGFHWTKQHSPALGEVYVVGIDPNAQGLGLGRALTRAGLSHLAGRGVSEVELYVESDNLPAIGLYRGLGFTHHARDTHVMYRRRP